MHDVMYDHVPGAMNFRPHQSDLDELWTTLWSCRRQSEFYQPTAQVAGNVSLESVGVEDAETQRSNVRNEDRTASSLQVDSQQENVRNLQVTLEALRKERDDLMKDAVSSEDESKAHRTLIGFNQRLLGQLARHELNSDQLVGLREQLIAEGDIDGVGLEIIELLVAYATAHREERKLWGERQARTENQVTDLELQLDHPRDGSSDTIEHLYQGCLEYLLEQRLAYSDLSRSVRLDATWKQQTENQGEARTDNTNHRNGLGPEDVYDNMLSHLQNAFRECVGELEDRHCQDLAEVTSLYEDQISGLKDQQMVRLAEADALHALDLETQAMIHDDEIAELNFQHDEIYWHLEDKASLEIQAVRDETDQLKQTHRHMLQLLDLDNKNSKAIYDRQYQTLHAENEKVKRALLQSDSARLAELIETIKQDETLADAKEQELRDQLAEKDRLLEAKDHELSELRIEIQNLDTENNENMTTLDIETEKAKESEAETRELRRQFLSMDDMEKTIAMQLREELDFQRGDYAAMLVQLHDNDNRIMELRACLDENKASSINDSKHAEELKCRITEIEEQLDTELQRSTSLANQVDQYRSKYNDILAAALPSNGAGAAEPHSVALSHVTRLNSQIEQLQWANKTFTEGQDRMWEKYDNLVQQGRAKSEEISILKSDLDMKSKQVESLADRLEVPHQAKEREYRQLLRQGCADSSAYESTIRGVEHKVILQSKEIGSLNIRLAERDLKIAQLEEDAAKGFDAAEQLKNENNSLLGDLQRLQEGFELVEAPLEWDDVGKDGQFEIIEKPSELAMDGLDEKEKHLIDQV